MLGTEGLLDSSYLMEVLFDPVLALRSNPRMAGLSDTSPANRKCLSLALRDWTTKISNLS
jgi:hypothetical protein